MEADPACLKRWQLTAFVVTETFDIGCDPLIELGLGLKECLY